LIDAILCSLKPNLRCEAELDPGFKQVIPYVILMNGSGEVFGTLRVGGDSRLQGRISIGLGGHMDGGEDMDTTLYRELNEEVGLTPDDIQSAVYYGSIYSEDSEVDSVHLGLIYGLVTNAESVECLEKDTLEGRWYTIDELRRLREESRMESWSEIVFDNILSKEVF